jgi:hypothetical protein
MRFASGARLGPFEILAPLGAGGMGEVYRARDTRLDRTVALKLLRSEFLGAPGRRVERFRHEARAIARITHPNICALHDVGEDGSAIFLVMEYVEGQTLAQRLEDGPLPLGLALRTAIGVADALDHAHRHGVVHRDVHPGNIILTHDGVKLLDFGLARLKEPDEALVTGTTDSARLTDDGVIVGTVPYMAPEQIEGREVDARTDIFSFGIVLFEMIAGRRPFVGDSRASLMAAIVAAEPPSLTSLQPQASPSLERLLARSLAKDPDERWQTARDMAAELRWISGEGPAMRAPGRPRRARGFARGVAAGVAMTALASAAIVWLLRPESVVPEYRQVTFRNGVVSSARFTPDGQSFVYSASWDGRPYAAFLGRHESADARDLQLRDARIVSISRSGEMALIFAPQNIERTYGVRTLARVPMAGGARRDLLTGVVAADWIPGTDALAVIRDPGGNRPWTVEFPAGTVVHEARAAWSLRVSPDGSRIAFFEGPLIFDSQPEAMVTVIDKAGHKTTIARHLTGLGLAWPPSGTEVWFTATRLGQNGPQLRAASLAGVERTVNRVPDWLVLHDISAEGRVLISRNTIRINLSCKPRAESQERDLTWLFASAVTSLSRDGATVIFADWLGRAVSSGNIQLFRRGVDGSPAVPIGEGNGGALSPDGRWVVAVSGEKLVLLPTGAGSMVTLPRGDLSRVAGGAWLSDSRRIVFTGDTGDGKPRGYVQTVDGPPRAITPDGLALPALAAVRDDHTVLARKASTWMLFSTDSGGPGTPFTVLAAQDIPVQWSDDGRYLYTVARIDPQNARPPGVDVVRVDARTGERVVWRTLTPADPVGVEDLRGTIRIAPDGQSYCYSYMRRLGDLFVVEGLR